MVKVLHNTEETKVCNWADCKRKGKVQGYQPYYCKAHERFGFITLSAKCFPKKYKYLGLTETKDKSYSLMDIIEKANFT